MKKTGRNCRQYISPIISGRQIYILPQWKESGLHGGLRFSLKEWNPDMLDGVIFTITPKEGYGRISLFIGRCY